MPNHPARRREDLPVVPDDMLDDPERCPSCGYDLKVPSHWWDKAIDVAGWLIGLACLALIAYLVWGR